MEDLFGDLVPEKKKDLPSRGLDVVGSRSTPPRPMGKEVPADAFTTAPQLSSVESETNGTSNKPNADIVFSISKEELKELLADTVQQAVELSFSKLVKSLRTVSYI